MEPKIAPKFVVGEDVRVSGCKNPKYSSDRTTVVEIIWIEKWADSSIPSCWSYITCNIKHLNGDKIHPECRLSKLPPNEKTSWEDCAWSPYKVEKKL